MSFKLIILFLLVGIGLTAYSQNDSLQKKTEYITIVADAFMRTSDNIYNSGNRNLLRYYDIPGIAFGADYSRISKRGITILTGLHYRLLPVSFQYTVGPNDFDPAAGWTSKLYEKFANYSLGHIYIPLQIGYAFRSTSFGWKPTFLLGLNLNHLLSYELAYQTTIGDPQGNIYPVFDLRILSPKYDNRLWTTYTVNTKVSRTLKRGNQFYIGLTANISTTTVYNGEYSFFFKDGTYTGKYIDKGSYVGLQFGYSLLRKPKQALRR